MVVLSRLLPPTLQLLPYQTRWVQDNARLKIVVKARQIGYSFAATLRAVVACLDRRTTWIFLSKGERQSRLLMDHVQEHVRSCGVVARARQETFFEGTSLRQLEVRFPNGSVIYGLPANPDTARGYSGNVTLDEFAFHTDADKIYTALFPTITRGHALEVISTPNGTQGKFYDLAKAAGLVEAVPGAGDWGLGKDNSDLATFPTRLSSSKPQPLAPGTQSLLARPQPLAPGTWSSHHCDIYSAVRQGLRINLELLRAGCEDESAWRQEFCCEFVSTAENFFPPELLARSLSAEATTVFGFDRPAAPPPRNAPARPSSPSSFPGEQASASHLDFENRNSKLDNAQPGSSVDFRVSNFEPCEYFAGVDIGRKHDRTVFWIDEVRKSKFENRNPETETRNSKIEIRHSTSGALEVPEEFRVSNFEFRTAAEGRVSVSRVVRVLDNVPFAEQLQLARAWMNLREGTGGWLIRRMAVDSTGIGAPLAESLAREFGPRVEPVVFTAAVKEDLAYRVKRRMEDGLVLLPDVPSVRRAFSTVKKFVTPAGHLRFDAERTEAGHADEFWAKALAEYAAETAPGSRASDAYLADGVRLIDPAAFAVTDAGWEGLL